MNVMGSGDADARDSHARTLAKTLSWRALAVATTTTVAFALTGRLEFAVPIGVTDSAMKLFLYYFHERAWERVSVGRVRELAGRAGEGGQ